MLSEQYRNQYGADQAECKTREGQVSSELTRLESAIAHASEAMIRLRDRLSGITRSEPKQPEALKDARVPQALVPLADAISANRVRVDSIASDMDTLSSLIEL